MALTFDGLLIPGPHGPADIDPPGVHVRRTPYAGLDGESEVKLSKRGRYIRYPIVIVDSSFTTAGKVVKLLQELDQKVLAHGTLAETGNTSRVFKNVTFEGFKAQPHDILRDDARTLASGVAAYHVRGMLVFYQLTVRDDG